MIDVCKNIMSEVNHFDCLILGAGISGLDVAYHLQKYSPWASYRILERRDNIGGTWDFFKYPGLRSDSDMFTFGYQFFIIFVFFPLLLGSTGMEKKL